jgi:transposase InsO family protein
VGADTLFLHADNGAPIKGVTLQRLGVVPSFSRPAVSNDNPYSESLFSTLKGHPSFPDQSPLRTWTRPAAGRRHSRAGTTPNTTIAA